MDLSALIFSKATSSSLIIVELKELWISGLLKKIRAIFPSLEKIIVSYVIFSSPIRA
jgi:hypothetical protein